MSTLVTAICIQRQPLPATPRHMSQLLPLLPSGPGGVYNLSLRGDRQEIPTGSLTCSRLLEREYKPLNSTTFAKTTASLLLRQREGE